MITQYRGAVNASGEYQYIPNTQRVEQEKSCKIKADNEYTDEVYERQMSTWYTAYKDEIDELRHASNPGNILYNRYNQGDAMQANHVGNLWHFLYDDVDTYGGYIEPILKGEPYRSGKIEEAEQGRFQRQMVNKQIQNIFDQSKLTIPKDVNFCITVGTDNRIRVTADDDNKDLATQMEQALNADSDNGKALSEHMRRSIYLPWSNMTDEDRCLLNNWKSESHSMNYRNGSLYDICGRRQFGDGETSWIQAVYDEVGTIGDADFETPDWMKARTGKDGFWSDCLLKQSREKLDSLFQDTGEISGLFQQARSLGIDLSKSSFSLSMGISGKWQVDGLAAPALATPLGTLVNQSKLARTLLRNVMASMPEQRYKHELRNLRSAFTADYFMGLTGNTFGIASFQSMIQEMRCIPKKQTQFACTGVPITAEFQNMVIDAADYLEKHGADKGTVAFLRQLGHTVSDKLNDNIELESYLYYGLRDMVEEGFDIGGENSILSIRYESGHFVM